MNKLFGNNMARGVLALMMVMLIESADDDDDDDDSADDDDDANDNDEQGRLGGSEPLPGSWTSQTWPAVPLLACTQSCTVRINADKQGTT